MNDDLGFPDEFTVSFLNLDDFLDAIEDAGEPAEDYIVDLVEAAALDLVLPSTFLPAFEFEHMVREMSRDLALIIRQRAGLPAGEDDLLALRIALATREQARVLVCMPVGHA